MPNNFTFTLKRLQEENKPWIEKNFHKQSKEVAWEPLLGIIEELGELQEAEDELNVELSDAKTKDAAGDVMIFMADYASCMGYNLQSLDSDENYYLNVSEMVVLIGKLSHAHLKLAQNIRTNQSHEDCIKQCLTSIITHLNACLGQDITLPEVCEEVWNSVKQRDWTVNKINGGIEGNTIE